MTKVIMNLRDEVRHLAEEAFRRKLISGHGDGENVHEYQLVIEGKPRHYSLERAYTFLHDLIEKHE